jgi:putative aldouronate transport system substrate-binding protein
MEMNRKSIALLLILFIAAAALFAGGGQSATQQRTGPSIVTAPGTFPVVNEPLTLRVFAGGAAAIENFETNDFTRYYEQKTGIRLQWHVTAPGQAVEQRRLVIAGGDWPDFFMGAGISKADEVLYGSEGVIIPLNSLIDTYSHWLLDMFREIPTARAMITAPDGNIYSFPQVTDTVHSFFSQKMFLNMEWMQNLNLQVPTTTEEFFNVMMAFRTRDPNGNGRADEIPHITFQPAGMGINEIFLYFVNSFIQMDSQGFLVTRDNRVDVAYNKPEFRQALEYLNRLVTNGLLDPSSFTITQAELRQLAENPNYQLIGSTVMQAPSSIFAMTSPRQRNFRAIAPLRGPNGVQLGSYNSAARISTGATAISSRARHPEAIVRWIDWFYDQEGLMTMRIGREGIEWNWAPPGTLSITGTPALWINIGAQGGQTNAFWMQYGGVGQFNRHSSQLGVSDDLLLGPEGLNTRIFNYTRDHYIPYTPERYLPPMFFEADVLQPIVGAMNDIISYRYQMWVRFVTGDMPLNDANWNAYVRQLDQMGQQNVINAHQRTYDTFLRNQGR